MVHRIIEEHTKAKGKRTVQQVKNDIMDGTLPFEPDKKAPELDSASQKKLAMHLGNYMRLADKIGYDGEIEWPFLIDLEPPEKRCIKGFLDRLIIKDGKAFILDWKTTKPSKWRKDSNTITKDLQLACYCWIVSREFDIPAKNVKAALYYLEDAKLVPVTYSENTLKQIPERLAAVYKTIEKSDPDKVYGTVADHCRRCDYRKVCPSYSLT